MNSEHLSCLGCLSCGRSYFGCPKAYQNIPEWRIKRNQHWPPTELEFRNKWHGRLFMFRSADVLQRYTAHSQEPASKIARCTRQSVAQGGEGVKELGKPVCSCTEQCATQVIERFTNRTERHGVCSHSVHAPVLGTTGIFRAKPGAPFLGKQKCVFRCQQSLPNGKGNSALRSTAAEVVVEETAEDEDMVATNANS